MAGNNDEHAAAPSVDSPESSEAKPRRDLDWLREAWALAALIPISAAIVATIDYILPGTETQPPGMPALIGLVAGLLIWASVVGLAHTNAKTNRTQQTLAEIKPRATIARERYLAAMALNDPPSQLGAAGEVRALQSDLDAALRPKTVHREDPVGLWRLLHRVEESLLLVTPREAVVADVLDDRQRLIGSTIPNADALRSAQAAALDVLEPGWVDTVVATATTARAKKG